MPYSVRPSKVLQEKRFTRQELSRRATQWLETLRRWPSLQPEKQPFHEHGPPSNELPTLFSQGTQRHGQKKNFITLYIPYESFIGSFIGCRFQLRRLQSQQDHLDIYAVTNLCGQPFEAQAFSLSSSISDKLMQARKRRIKRLLQSRNFVCEIQQAGQRFLISYANRSDSEWNNLCRRAENQRPALTSHEPLAEEDFPDLAASRCKKGSISCDSASELARDCETTRRRNKTARSLDGSSVWSSSRPASSLASHSSGSSYAEAAAKGLENDRRSRTGKGVKQRQRRQRKREGKGNPSNSSR